ncbi:hypothetical protein H310_12440 [Aphanomyces invadans]|uniref:Transposase Tc1-like domain-containing protein n=1 Tax=Aphanomyces invadans TaxID=157072 RepID=A0A024THY2_9STRA|nr:hypothetical protein H310_12440 [Aphanomyces invadans]ETV93673.1 hypothetical protein H310_12440 [Aphanomyces invadans]|eukprot:XP_008877714.1 hypothetical protein H310_12440 [Aphanomyces invadans]
MSSARRTQRELCEKAKREIVTVLQDSLCMGKLPHGTIKATLQKGSTKSLKKGRVGRKARYTTDEIKAAIQEVPHQQRSTMRDLSDATGISAFTLNKALKTGVVQRRSTRLKTLLTDANKYERLDFYCAHLVLSRSAIDEYLVAVAEGNGSSSDETTRTGSPSEVPFSGMWDVVHLDEKWFNADKDRRKVYLVDGEEVKPRGCKSKRFLPKVMFLCAVARPQPALGFDVKIGLWPFVAAAARS